MITRVTVRFIDEEKATHDAMVKSARNNRRSLNSEMLRAFDFYLKEAPEAQYETREVEEKKSPK